MLHKRPPAKPSLIKRKLIIMVAIPVVAAMAIAAYAFYWTPFRIGERPRTGEPPDISGVYLFKKENCSPSGCFFGMVPEFSISYLPDGERVRVSKAPDGYVIAHAGWQNKPMKMELSRNNPNLGWNHKKIVYQRANWAVGLGLSRESRMLHFFVDDKRSLIIRSKYRETGLALFIIPFSESYTHEMKLVRVDAS